MCVSNWIRIAAFFLSSPFPFFVCSFFPQCMLVGLFARAKDAGCRLTMHVFKGLISVQWIIRRDVGSGRDSGRGWLSAWDLSLWFPRR